MIGLSKTTIKERDMPTSLHLYNKLLRQIEQWLPQERVTRRRNLALLVCGLCLSGSVHLDRIVSYWPLPGKIASLSNRLRRFLSREGQPATYLDPLLAEVLWSLSLHPVLLALDITQVGRSCRALMVTVAYRGRTLPLTWQVYEGSCGNVPVEDPIALLEQVYAHIPFGVEVCLVGDAAFRSGDLLWWLQNRGWNYVIRQRRESFIRTESGAWQPISDLAIQPGGTLLVGPVWLFKTNPFGPTSLLLHWATGHDQPWILVSSYADPTRILRLYRRRAWIETMFGDMKSRGFDLHATRLAHRRRIEWLLLGVSITYLWLVLLGSWVVKNGYRHEIDRKDRRDKSYFRLGWDWIVRCLRLGHPVPVHFAVTP